jgi:hypothetical protein
MHLTWDRCRARQFERHFGNSLSKELQWLWRSGNVDSCASGSDQIYHLTVTNNQRSERENPRDRYDCGSRRRTQSLDRESTQPPNLRFSRAGVANVAMKGPPADASRSRWGTLGHFQHLHFMTIKKKNRSGQVLLGLGLPPNLSGTNPDQSRSVELVEVSATVPATFRSELHYITIMR